jgi:hypothetical protein
MTTNRPKAAAMPAPEWPLRPDRMVHNNGHVIIRNTADGIQNGASSYGASD